MSALRLCCMTVTCARPGCGKRTDAHVMMRVESEPMRAISPPDGWYMPEVSIGLTLVPHVPAGSPILLCSEECVEAVVDAQEKAALEAGRRTLEKWANKTTDASGNVVPFPPNVRSIKGPAPA